MKSEGNGGNRNTPAGMCDLELRPWPAPTRQLKNDFDFSQSTRFYNRGIF